MSSALRAAWLHMRDRVKQHNCWQGSSLHLLGKKQGGGAQHSTEQHSTAQHGAFVP